jgi:uncharacterized delta-60 repeat protein
VELLERRRLLAAGQLDPTFGAGGLATSGPPELSAAGQAVAVQGDGKILVAGYSFANGGFEPRLGEPGDHLLRRFNADGSPDLSFGAGGEVVTDFAGGADSARAVALTGDGRIMVAGIAYFPGTTRPKVTLLRYLPDGRLDGAFGQGGKLAVALPDTANLNHSLSEMVVAPDGKIVLAGKLERPQRFDMLFVRLGADGSLDPTFGSGGIVAFNAGLTVGGVRTADTVSDLALKPDGKIVGAGSALWPNDGSATAPRSTDHAVARLNADGTRDATFGSGGVAVSDFGNANEWTAAVAPRAGRVSLPRGEGRDRTPAERRDQVHARGPAGPDFRR